VAEHPRTSDLPRDGVHPPGLHEAMVPVGREQPSLARAYRVLSPIVLHGVVGYSCRALQSTNACDRRWAVRSSYRRCYDLIGGLLVECRGIRQHEQRAVRHRRVGIPLQRSAHADYRMSLAPILGRFSRRIWMNRRVPGARRSSLDGETIGHRARRRRPTGRAFVGWVPCSLVVDRGPSKPGSLPNETGVLDERCHGGPDDHSRAMTPVS
jgi:hypothetical protein